MLEVHASITELDELRGLSRGDCIGRSAEALGGPPEKRKVAERFRGGRAEQQACVMGQCQRLVLEASFDTSGYGPCVGLTVAARQGLLRRRERAPGCRGPELRRAGDPAFRIPVRDREGRARNPKHPCHTREVPNAGICRHPVSATTAAVEWTVAFPVQPGLAPRRRPSLVADGEALCRRSPLTSSAGEIPLGGISRIPTRAPGIRPGAHVNY